MFSRHSVSMLTPVLLLLIMPCQAAAGVPPIVLDNNKGLPSLAPLLSKVTPAVVSVGVKGRISNEPNPLFDDPVFRRFFELPERPAEREFMAAGSGVIVDAGKGYVFTNHHLIENADEITVSLRDGRQLTAKLLGTDPETDVALLQIPAAGLQSIPIGDSDQLQVGDFVIAVGNPFGLGQTVTSGIVSALGRSGLGIEGYEDFIQTDASINPGNSGGALIDLGGRLVGINSAIVGSAGGNIGIGFAIPANMAQAVMLQLLAHGKVQRGQLGITIQNLTPDLAATLGIDIWQGALVAAVVEGSAAAKAGVKAGDVIVALDGEAIRSAAELRNKVGLAPADKTIRLELLREGVLHSVSATLIPR